MDEWRVDQSKPINQVGTWVVVGAVCFGLYLLLVALGGSLGEPLPSLALGGVFVSIFAIYSIVSLRRRGY